MRLVLLPKKIMLLTCILCGTWNMAAAEQYQPQYRNGQAQNGRNHGAEQYQIGKDLPDVANANRYLYPAIHRDRVEMGTAKRFKQYKDIQAQEHARKEILKGIYDMDISMKPEYRILRDVDEISITPMYTIGIFLPDEMIITDATASFPCTVKSFKNNMIRIQPKEGFYSGNLSIVYTDGKKNLYMTILFKRYFQSRAEVEDYITAIKKSSPSIAASIEKKYRNINDYAHAKNNTSLIYKYVLPTIISDDEAIKLYERMTKKKGINIENGDYVSFLYDGVTYRIIRDDVQGTLIYGKRAYRVENSMQDSF